MKIDTGSSMSGHCVLCSKQFRKNIYPWSWMDEELYRWHAMLHYLIRHGKKIWKFRTLLLRFCLLVITFLLTIIEIPIKLVCLPFWAIYNFL